MQEVILYLQANELPPIGLVLFLNRNIKISIYYIQYKPLIFTKIDFIRFKSTY